MEFILNWNQKHHSKTAQSAEIRFRMQLNRICKRIFCTKGAFGANKKASYCFIVLTQSGPLTKYCILIIPGSRSTLQHPEVKLLTATCPLHLVTSSLMICLLHIHAFALMSAFSLRERAFAPV